MYCTDCGKEIGTEGVFCPFCGKKQRIYPTLDTELFGADMKMQEAATEVLASAVEEFGEETKVLNDIKRHGQTGIGYVQKLETSPDPAYSAAWNRQTEAEQRVEVGYGGQPEVKRQSKSGSLNRKDGEQQKKENSMQERLQEQKSAKHRTSGYPQIVKAVAAVCLCVILVCSVRLVLSKNFGPEAVVRHFLRAVSEEDMTALSKVIVVKREEAGQIGGSAGRLTECQPSEVELQAFTRGLRADLEMVKKVMEDLQNDAARFSSGYEYSGSSGLVYIERQKKGYVFSVYKVVIKQIRLTANSNL